jgi:hypothetical protein
VWYEALEGASLQLYIAQPPLLLLLLLLPLLSLLHLRRLEPSLLTSHCRRVQCGMRR